MTASLLVRARRALGRLRRSEDGNATIEFVLVVPPLLIMFISAFEIGMANVQNVMLERATDLAVRELRLLAGNASNNSVDHEALRNRICADAKIIPDCTESLQIELTPVSTTTWNILKPEIDCIDRTGKIEPVISFEDGQQNELMLMRVCAVIDPMFPTIGLGAMMPKDASGGYKLVAVTAFVNEPS